MERDYSAVTNNIILSTIMLGEKLAIYMPKEKIKEFPERLRKIPKPIPYVVEKAGTLFTFYNGAEITLLSPSEAEIPTAPEPLIFDESAEMTPEMWEAIKKIKEER
jgi:hypothetical protein